MKTLRILILTILFFLPGCWLFYDDDDYEFEFDDIVTDYPVNLEGINSDRDDYNSHLPYEYYGYIIFFSSNYPTYGVNFNIISKKIEITYHKEKGDILNVSYPEWDESYSNEKKMFK